MSSLEKEFLERIEKHKGVLFKISKMYMDTPEDQNDLFQEITYQLWKAYPTFQEKSKFSTWMYRVALNTAIIFLKSEKKKQSLSSNQEIQNINISDEDNSEEEYKIKIMYEAIHQLSPIDKALIFYYLEDYSGREMAEQLGLTEGNTRVKLNRAKQKLTEIVNQLMLK